MNRVHKEQSIRKRDKIKYFPFVQSSWTKSFKSTAPNEINDMALPINRQYTWLGENTFKSNIVNYSYSKNSPIWATMPRSESWYPACGLPKFRNCEVLRWTKNHNRLAFTGFTWNPYHPLKICRLQHRLEWLMLPNFNWCRITRIFTGAYRCDWRNIPG